MWNLKVGQAVSEKKTVKDFMILYLYIVQGQRGGIGGGGGGGRGAAHCKFQPLVSKTYWKKATPPNPTIQICKEANFTLPLKKVKGQPTIIVWTNLIDLETAMLYTKIQLESFLDSGEEDF